MRKKYYNFVELEIYYFKLYVGSVGYSVFQVEKVFLQSTCT